MAGAATGKKRGPGRPVGINYPVAVKTYITEQDQALLKVLAQQRGISEAALLRMLIREEADRKQLNGQMAAAALKAQADYSASEVQAWASTGNDYVEEPEG